jgi:hypothetical protein
LAQPTLAQQPTLARQPTLAQPAAAQSTPASAPSTAGAATPVSFTSPTPNIRVVDPSSSKRVPELGELPAAASTAGAPLSTSKPSTAATDAASTNFGYDPQYRWLKGKLEYSQSTRSWRLRYISPDGATDNYGGSVILPDAAKLNGLQLGDLVYAEGTPGAAGSDPSSFAPQYNLQRIAKQ